MNDNSAYRLTGQQTGSTRYRSFSAAGSSSVTEPYCFFCRMHGHYIEQCKSRKMKCMLCGEYGHHFLLHNMKKLVREDFSAQIISYNDFIRKYIQYIITDIDILSNGLAELVSEKTRRSATTETKRDLRRDLRRDLEIDTHRKSLDTLQNRFDFFKKKRVEFIESIVFLNEFFSKIVNEKHNGNPLEHTKEAVVVTCLICQTYKVDRVTICCGNCLCSQCIRNMLVTSKMCPFCRAPISYRSISI
jgi:hypothetical protein